MENERAIPLAERMRPHSLDEVIGQKKLVGENGILRKIVDNKEPTSLIFWGPPGTGKTTLARIIASEMNADFIEISAVSAKKADVDEVIARARQNWGLQIRTILFVDEIHRFNKAQQDAFLPHVESGLITLIGATTENPSFEVISPLISRSRVIVLEQLSRDEIKEIIYRAALFIYNLSSSGSSRGSSDKLDYPNKSGNDNTKIREKISKKITDDAIETLANLANGDARTALGTLEIATNLIKNRQKITPEIIEQAAGKKLPRYDKKGDGHYDTISAFIKSMRGGQTDAALYYLARMVAAGEDPKFIARRMVIFASEDIGLAGNGALNLALSAFMAIERVGMPEGGIILSHVVVALSRAKKSRESYDLWQKWQKLAEQFPDAKIPLHIRNGSTKLMQDLGYGDGYEWKTGFKHAENYLPNEIVEFLNKNQK
ncbi:MAG: replication-associated recombination protein A [Candidatus Nomurabacteria bacterium]|jgi:putative ATPase|nr:replication-associated recombination protein A [Candidatus Nomurabacteria bacterium]